MVTNSGQFWVIFDLAPHPHPNFYLDVHNILALPSNSIIRYEYRQKYLSDVAKSFSDNMKSAPIQVLHVFAQIRGHTRLDPAPASSTPLHETWSDTLWVATRLSELVNIAPRDGENYYYFLRVSGYPKVDSEKLMQILRPLADTDEVPFRKLVAISDQTDALAELSTGDDATNWQNIVSQLALPPIKFAGDVFWRLENRSDRVSTKYRLRTKKREYIDEGPIYRIAEGGKQRLVVTSYEPSGAGQHRIASGIPEAVLTISTNDDANVLIEGTPDKLQLEQYGKKVITVKAAYRTEIDKHLATLTLSTGKRQDNYAQGPEFSVRFEVFKPVWKRLALIMLPILGFLLVGMAHFLQFDGVLVAITAIIIGVLGLLWVSILSGQYKLSLPFGLLLILLLFI